MTGRNGGKTPFSPARAACGEHTCTVMQCIRGSQIGDAHKSHERRTAVPAHGIGKTHHCAGFQVVLHVHLQESASRGLFVGSHCIC